MENGSSGKISGNMMAYKCSREAEERGLQTGYQEIEGISLGYLRVDGRQMFALAQVVSDLFKDIPRATVNKKMEILQIKSRRCDLKELRSLKAINSVPSRAVKCSLISKEDLEILCMSCRALSPNRRKRKKKYRRRVLQTADFFYTSLYKKPRELLARTSELAALYAQTSSLHPKPSLNCAKFCSSTTSLPPVPVSRNMLNYEKNGKGTNGYNLEGRVDFFTSMASSYPRTHLSPVGGHGASNPTQSIQQFQNKKHDQCTDHRAVQGFFKDHKPPLRCHIQKTVVRKKKHNSLRVLKKAQGTSAGYSSDSNSSLDFDKDSDFRSNGSSSTESSDEDNGEEGISSSAGCSSSDSDSSSLCSGDSVQSTRFRQAILASLGSRLGTSKDTSGSTHERLSGPSHTRTTQIAAQNHLPLQSLQVESKFPQDTQHEWNSPPASNLDSFEQTQRKGEENAEFGHLGSLTHAEATPTKSTIPVDLQMCTDRAALPKEPPSQTLRKDAEGPVPDCADRTSLHCDDPAVTDTPCFSSLSQDTAPSSSPIQTPAAHPDEVAPEADRGTTTQSCCPDTTLGPPEGGLEDPRRENFDRLIRQSKLWCYAKGFNVDGKDLRLGIPKTSKDYYDCVDTKSSGQKRTRRRSSSLGNGMKGNSKRRRRSSNSKTDRQQSGTASNSQKSRGRKAGTTATNNCKRVRSSISAQSSGTNPHSFRLMAHFPCPPSLVVGEDGDLQPACSLVTDRTKQFPVSPFHPVWYWQMGATVPLGLHSFGFHGYKSGNS
ncbi:elongin BC and Polycomb repressive complex 2-associated protein [Protopterus annectens]|uniref:elongin BC and Polycomb repressive complex 2-associated protein n=1 Tax=Protopterus annectens TaxID=7888 RepID=UPI001CFC3F5B|nr:elongin BC and Polycomb repressive complex 2-associated protein [Protopterus annectens]